MELETFYRQIEHGGYYHSPAQALRQPPVKAGSLAALNFYAGGLGAVVFRGLVALCRGRFDNRTLGHLSYLLLRKAEKLGTPVTFSGFEALKNHQGPLVFVANHMSLIETILLPCGLMAFGPLSIVARRSLARYPGFGRVLRATKPILVTRSNPRQDLADVLKQGAEHLAAGHTVLLFPQGTRTRAFDPARFNSLGVKLARRAGVPLLPIAVKTDFALTGRWMREFGPVDPSRAIKFAAGPLLPPDGSQREIQNRCVDFIAGQLRAWNLPVKAMRESPQSPAPPSTKTT